MKRTLRQSTALLLAMLMVFSSVGMILGLAVDDEPAAPVWPEGYRVVDGASDEDLWVDPVEGKLDYSFAYNFAMDTDSLIFYFVTATANLKTGGDVFRVWLRDNAEATAYTDFVTVKESGGAYVLSSAKYNKELHSNSGANWDEYLTASVSISAKAENDYTHFTVSMPLAAFDGLENQTYIDAWVSLWPVVEGSTNYTCLHSGVGGAPTGGTASWNSDADYTYSWATVDGQFDESCWEDGWTTVDGVNVGQWQASDSTKEGFSYDYKFYFSTEYLYLGVVYNQAPSFYYNSQTNASNIRIWFADTQTTATGKFDGLVDVRYTGLTAEAIVAERTTDAVDIDETKVVVGDVQDENSWSVEIAIPLSELGLLGWDDSTYYGLGLTVSDPFGACEETRNLLPTALWLHIKALAIRTGRLGRNSSRTVQSIPSITATRFCPLSPLRPTSHAGTTWKRPILPATKIARDSGPLGTLPICLTALPRGIPAVITIIGTVFMRMGTIR